MPSDHALSDSYAVYEPAARVPPHNIDAEQALLGAILMNNDAAGHVREFLLARHFYEPVHQRIFEAASKLIDRDMIADAITLRQYFEQDGALEDIGGGAYLARLSAAGVPANAAHYGKVIYDLALRRELILISEETAERAFDADIDDSAQAQIESAEQQLFTLSETGASESGFRHFRTALTRAVEMAETAFQRDGEVTGVATGLVGLDRLLGGLHPSDLVILAGRPAMGKTALATNIAFHAASQYRTEPDDKRRPKPADGAIVGFFSLEMSAEQLATRILAEQAELSSDRIRRGVISTADWHRIVEASQRLQDVPLHIDDTPALSIAALRTRARRLKRTHGLDLIVVDYLQLLRPLDRTENRVQEISEITQGLKALAKDLDIPVLALSQLSRAVEQRENKRPQLSDLRESGSIEQDADVVMFVYREEYYHEFRQPDPDTEEHAKWMAKAEEIHGIAEVIVGKQRHGPTGTVRLQFEREITKFRNLETANYDGNAGF